MSIKIKSLSPEKIYDNSLKGNYLYKDLELDLTPDVFFNKHLNKKESLKDVAALYDEEAVKNSVVTAFITSPGDKILNPTYGINLNQYVFEPIDDFILDIIKDDIETKLPIMEPRIQVSNLEVFGDEDEQTIYINLQINVPSLDIYGLSIKSQLNSSGYTVL